jgi:hypothetical protein
MYEKTATVSSGASASQSNGKETGGYKAGRGECKRDGDKHIVMMKDDEI